MKRIKKFIIISLVILFSGCSAEYNLDIHDDIFSESIKVSLSNFDDTDLIPTFDEDNQYVSSSSTLDLIYDKTKEDDGENSIYTYTHDFSFDEFKGSLNNKCFDNLKINEEEGIYSLTAYGFNCLNGHQTFADDYKINIKTDYKVINNNADEVKGNTYTWYLDQKENKKKNIIFQYSKTKKEVSKDNIFTPIIISIVVASLILVGVILLNNFRINRGE